MKATPSPWRRTLELSRPSAGGARVGWSDLLGINTPGNLDEPTEPIECHGTSIAALAKGMAFKPSSSGEERLTEMQKC